MVSIPLFSQERNALLMVHFGTSYDETRALTIDAVNKLARVTFPEMASLRRDVESLAPFFDEIRVGEPLLCSVDDCRKVAEILLQRHGDRADAKKHAHVVFVGHGTYAPANATYSQMEHLFRHLGGPLFHVATIEGYPTLETLLADLKAAKARKVTLVPMLLVAGDHATNDISGEWKEALEAAGMEVDVVLEGLGQVPEIQALYLDHTRNAQDK